jgi:hypothetical protein
MPSSQKRPDDLLRRIPSRSARVHCVGPSHNLDQALGLEMPAPRHRLAYGGEQLEVVSLARAQRIAVEMRDYSFDEEREASYLPLHGLVASVGPERAAAEVFLDRQEHFIAVAVLADRQTSAAPPSRLGESGEVRSRP